MDGNGRSMAAAVVSAPLVLGARPRQWTMAVDCTGHHAARVKPYTSLKTNINKICELQKSLHISTKNNDWKIRKLNNRITMCWLKDSVKWKVSAQIWFPLLADLASFLLHTKSLFSRNELPIRRPRKAKKVSFYTLRFFATWKFIFRSAFHKTLPRYSAFVNWISVRFNEIDSKLMHSIFVFTIRVIPKIWIVKKSPASL